MSLLSDSFLSSAFSDATSDLSSDSLFENEYEGVVRLGGTAYRCQIDISSTSIWGKIWLEDLRSHKKWYVYMGQEYSMLGILKELMLGY